MVWNSARTARRFLRRKLLTWDLRRRILPPLERRMRPLVPEWVLSLSLGNAVPLRPYRLRRGLLVSWREHGTQESALHAGRLLDG